MLSIQPFYCHSAGIIGTKLISCTGYLSISEFCAINFIGSCGIVHKTLLFLFINRGKYYLIFIYTWEFTLLDRKIWISPYMPICRNHNFIMTLRKNHSVDILKGVFWSNHITLYSENRYINNYCQDKNKNGLDIADSQNTDLINEDKNPIQRTAFT